MSEFKAKCNQINFGLYIYSQMYDVLSLLTLTVVVTGHTGTLCSLQSSSLMSDVL